MNSFDITRLDFRALHTLKLAHDLRSFSLAAARLGQNQSTVSYAIDRLRELFGDELFVRQGRSLAPTPRCVEIVAGIEKLTDHLAELFEPQVFDPPRSDIEVVVSCNHYERAVLLPRIVGRLRREAPSMRLKVINARTAGHEQLRRGECDLLLSPLMSEGPGLYRRNLLIDRYVCLLDPANPLAEGEITPERFAAAAHVFISYEGGWRPSYRDVMETQGIAPRMMLDLPSSGDLGTILKGTDLVATVSHLLARTFQPVLAVRRGPFDSTLRIQQYWNERTHRSRAHIWFRNLLAEEGAAAARRNVLPGEDVTVPEGADGSSSASS